MTPRTFYVGRGLYKNVPIVCATFNCTGDLCHVDHRKWEDVIAAANGKGYQVWHGAETAVLMYGKKAEVTAMKRIIDILCTRTAWLSEKYKDNSQISWDVVKVVEKTSRAVSLAA